MIEHDAVVQCSIQATCRACCAEHVATSPARPHPRAHHNACCLHVASHLSICRTIDWLTRGGLTKKPVLPPRDSCQTSRWPSLVPCSSEWIFARGATALRSVSTGPRRQTEPRPQLRRLPFLLPCHRNSSSDARCRSARRLGGTSGSGAATWRRLCCRSKWVLTWASSPSPRATSKCPPHTHTHTHTRARARAPLHTYSAIVVNVACGRWALSLLLLLMLLLATSCSSTPFPTHTHTCTPPPPPRPTTNQVPQGPAEPAVWQ
jgi:hypothetical protein